ncbi:Xylose isomerase [Serratia fonticola]|uniref:xylose isomerase n=1 Tax=Serratia fonticola TaxID=47917 RepID=A0A4U9VJG4_SERFO|nr:Xylose isomerase [Serratia fonticola]
MPYYCFHDIDVSPEGATLKEYLNNFAIMTDVLAEKQQSSGVKLLWGTGQLLHPSTLRCRGSDQPGSGSFQLGSNSGVHGHECHPQTGR